MARGGWECGCSLQCVEHLFLDLLELVFHLHHDVLHLSLIALGARSVDFASHLLGDEAQLLAVGSVLVERLAEVFQVIGQSLLLLTDVQLLDISSARPSSAPPAPRR